MSENESNIIQLAEAARVAHDKLNSALDRENEACNAYWKAIAERRNADSELGMAREELISATRGTCGDLGGKLYSAEQMIKVAPEIRTGVI